MSTQSPHKNAHKRLAILVVGISSVFSVLLIALLFAIGDKEPVQLESVQSEEIIDLLQSPMAGHADSKDVTSPDVGVELPKGGWVQQTDSLGNLVQQYRCEALDPSPPLLPEGWIEMKKPEVEIYLSDNKLVLITGDVGIANAPKRMLESGEISGHVTVSMYELGTQQSREGLSPSMVMTTPQANFDNFIGEITCDSEVRVVSEAQTLVGRRLSIRFNDKEERVEYLRLEELDYIEFYPNKNKPLQTTVHPIRAAQVLPKKKNKEQTTHRVKAAAVGQNVDYYIISFFDNVKIVQGNQHTGKYATGDTLTVAFSSESESSTMANVNPISRISSMLPYGMQSALVATVLAAAPIQPEPPVRLTCDNGLTMVPLEDESLMPSSVEETRIELLANADSSILLIDNEQGLTASGTSLRYELTQDRTDLFGAPASVLMNDMNTVSKHLWVSRQTGQGAAVGEGSSTSVATNGTTSLIWNEGVEFFFDSDDKDGALREVICNGGVVLAEDGSTVECETLIVEFQKTPDGSSTPSVAIATGNVNAISESQTLWSDQARVTFKSGENNADEENTMFGGAKADTMYASGNVQVLLDDGGRAFCNSLEGNIAQDSVQLSGNVVIAYKRMLMNRGESATLSLDRLSGKGKWVGAGQALFLDDPLDVSANERILRPHVTTDSEAVNKTNNISMRTNWHESMHLDRTFNDNAGAVDLAGNVDVRSQRNQYERSMMTGNELRLEFMLSEKNSTDDERILDTVIAKNDAKIEHRLWDATSPEALPVVYYIGGNHIEFDANTLDTLAVGQGVLMLRDPREPVAELHQSSLAGRGITRFTWDEKLKTTKINDTLYRIQMNGNVQMLHKGLDGVVGRLTSEQLDAIAVDPNKVETNAKGRSEIVLKGMDLQQLQAKGSVYIETESRAVDCDVFDYNLRTGIAKLTADKNRTLAILTQGSPYPVRANSIIWNMDPAVDTITITGLQGSSSN
jgi:lipopolysaccharide export system protein LptA